MPEETNDTGGRRRRMRETSVVRVMTSTSMRHHPTAFSTTQLPMLETLLDAGAMTARLATLLAPIAAPGTRPTVAYAKLVAYKQGNRGLIHYDVTGTSYGPSIAVYGKLYPALTQAMRADQTMAALRQEVFAGEAELGVPQTLGCLEDVAMLVYIPAEGDLLDAVMAGDQALRYMRLAGQWLGRLHQQPLALDREFHIATELVNIRAWVTLIGTKYPDVQDASTRIADYLERAAVNLKFDNQAPIHKDFHYGHIVVNGGLKVIDFDEIRLGDANFDLAHFCANLHLLAYRTSHAPFQFSTLQSAFLNAYAERSGWTPNERFVYFYAYTCLKIAKQLCTMRGLRPRPEGDEQHRQVQLMIEQGVSALPKPSGRKLAGRFATMVMDAKDLGSLQAPEA